MVLSDVVLKLALSMVVGGLIGAEREFRHRAAGFRTIIFICTGSTMFTMFSLELGGEVSPVRIAAHMVTGVGFLCAGVILEEKSRIVGLTTASTIWFTAAMGMGIGGGLYEVIAVALVGAMLILWVFPKIEAWIYSQREMRTYRMVCDVDRERMKGLEGLLRSCGLRIRGRKMIKKADEMVCIIETYGAPEEHERAMERLFADKSVREFRY